MAGQAGWYRAPGEEGLLRYWNGESWTDHRQPAPTAAPEPAAQPAPVVVADLSMDQFEKQFESIDPAGSVMSDHEFAPSSQQTSVREAAVMQAPISAFAPPALAPERPGSLAGAPAPFAMPSAEPVESLSLASAPAPTPERPIEPTETQRTATRPTTPRQQTAATPDVKRANRRPRSMVGAIVAMAIGLLLILASGGAILYSSSPVAGSGRVVTQAIVTNLNATAQSCAPEARFAASGGSYVAEGDTSVAPCPLQLGQSVNVSYVPAHPKTTGRIATPLPYSQYSWGVILIGAVILLGGIGTLLVRLVGGSGSRQRESVSRRRTDQVDEEALART